MSILIITQVLFLSGDVDSDSNGLANVSNRSVQFEGPLRLFRSIIGFSHQVVDQLMSQWVQLNFGNHVDHLRNHGFSLRHVQLQGLAILLSPVIMNGGSTPLLFTLVVLSNLEVFFSVSIIVLEHDLGVLVHLLMRLGNHEGIVTLASQDQKFDSFLLGALSFTVLSNFQSALGKLTLLAEDVLGALSIVK